MLFPPNFDTPLIVQKKDGGFGYDATDLMALKYRIDTLKADWVIYVVDSGQSLHFQQVFAAARQAGWVRDARLDHVGFGVVQGEDRKRLRTRAGSSVRLVDLLDEACDRAAAIMRQRVGAGLSSLSDGAEIARGAEKLGIGGVKYFDLRQNRLSDYVFSFDRMLSPDGDTNVYLQYSHARIMSILRKAGRDAQVLANAADITLEQEAEWKLACSLLRFNDVIEQIAGDLMPHRLCNYLYELCSALNGFYSDCRVIGAPEQESRLALLAATEKVMRQGFALLGIETLDRVCSVC